MRSFGNAVKLSLWTIIYINLTCAVKPLGADCSMSSDCANEDNGVECNDPGKCACAVEYFVNDFGECELSKCIRWRNAKSLGKKYVGFT